MKKYAGENNNASKLTWEQVHYIRNNYQKRKNKQKHFADLFGVSRPCISYIIQKKTWIEDEK